MSDDGSDDTSNTSSTSSSPSLPSFPAVPITHLLQHKRIVPLDELPDYSDGKVPEFLGAKGPFDKKQKALILAVYAPKYLAMRAARPRPRKRARSSWLKKAIAEVMESPLFQNLGPERTQKQWGEVRPQICIKSV